MQPREVTQLVHGHTANSNRCNPTYSISPLFAHSIVHRPSCTNVLLNP
jgi:hypothetical protein